MPVFVFFLLILFVFVSQFEFSFFFNFFYKSFFYEDFLFFSFINNLNYYNIISYNYFNYDNGFQSLDYMKLDYNYNYRTYFTQTYLHAAYNKHIKPYKNLLNVDRLFGDYNLRTYGKSKKHARAMKHTRIFMLLYSHTIECFAFNNKLVSSPTVMFFFKKQHLYSVLEMFYASIYLGMIYFFSFTYVRMVEDSALNLRETEEIDEEHAQNDWYYYREDRRGIIEPAIDDNIELDFAYPQHPVEWDDDGHLYRWEMHFFIFLFSFLICWGVSQSAASMFFYDNFIDLHFMGWATTFLFVFIFWRIFTVVQFFFFFNRFNIRKILQLNIFTPIFVYTFNFLLRMFASYLSPFLQSVFLRFVKLLRLEVSENNFMPLNLNFSSQLNFLKNLVVRFYRFIYYAFQKNLNFFEKRNIYDFLMSSNLIFFYNSRSNVDNVFYSVYKTDRIFSNIYRVTQSFIDNYGFSKGFFFPKNMYLTTNKILFPSSGLFPKIFPFYLDFFNVNDLPIWGADFFFSLDQNVFGHAESYESWFFSAQYKSRFDNAPLSHRGSSINLKKIVFNF